MKPGKKNRAPKDRKRPQRGRRTTAERQRHDLGDNQAPSDFNGFLTIRLKPGLISHDALSLDGLALEYKLDRLASLMRRYDSPSTRLITSVSVNEIINLEQDALGKIIPSTHSLNSYWRFDARGLGKSLDELDEVLAEFRAIPEVDFACREQRVSEPAATPTDYSRKQRYLDRAPTGIDARWAWNKGIDCAGLHFIDLEQGWFLEHEDLPNPRLIFNCNFNDPITRDHGTAVLGIVTGVDNGRGIKGIARGLTSVRVVSRFKAASCPNGHDEENCRPAGTDSGDYVADAICAALWASPRPHVLLLEVQRGQPELPTETNIGDWEAIQRAVAAGIIVIEAAGNGGKSLDSWVDAEEERRLSREKRFDSGAILVGAAKKDTLEVSEGAWAHERIPESNFGSRIDCYAWGETIVSTGSGDLRPKDIAQNVTQPDNERYTRTFAGTSGASAIIAGAALLVQGLQLKKGRPLLSPTQMRQLLSDPATGTRAINPRARTRAITAKHIGVMPDLRRILGKIGV